MEVGISSFELQEVIKIIADKLRTKIKSNGAELCIDIPKRYGSGTIKGIDFLDGIGFLRWDCTFKQDFILRYDENKKQPIRLIFCHSGEIIHILNPDNFRYKLNPMVGSIACSTNGNQQILMLPPNREIAYFTLEIDKEKFYPKIEKELHTVPEKLASVFRDLENVGHFLYQADYSLTISECLNEIENNPHEGMVRRIFLESKALDLLWMQIKQYNDDQNPLSQQSVIRKTDVKLIMKAKRILTEDLKSSPDIHRLAELTGTNATKLKRGFKVLYHTTINQYLRNERLNKAKLLLAEENLSIKEIAEAVGYSSKSVFSKRFKEKFGVLPRTFLNRYKNSN